MSRPMKFFLVALVVSAVVTYGYLASRRKAKPPAANKADRTSDSALFFTRKDGSIDYSRLKNGSPVPLG